MLAITKSKLDEKDFDVILASDLMDDDGNFYTITLKQALDEILSGEQLVECQYCLGIDNGEKKLLDFIGWTTNKVIFNVRGMFYEDSLLSWVPRNPSENLEKKRHRL